MVNFVWFAVKYPGGLVFITALKLDQAENIAFKDLAEHLKRMKAKNQEGLNTVVDDRNFPRPS
jgi:hypothetical protein